MGAKTEGRKDQEERERLSGSERTLLSDRLVDIFHSVCLITKRYSTLYLCEQVSERMCEANFRRVFRFFCRTSFRSSRSLLYKCELLFLLLFVLMLISNRFAQLESNSFVSGELEPCLDGPRIPDLEILSPFSLSLSTLFSLA